MSLPKLTRRRRKLLVTACVVVVGLLITYLNQRTDLQTNPTINNVYRVTAVMDGDTIEVSMNGVSEKVRFIGVDTPETQDPRKAVQCFGKAASEFTKQKLIGKTVRLELDPLSSNRDRYERLLRYVYVDQLLLNADIIEQGYGFAYTSFPFTKSEQFKQLERQAREQNRGLWNQCTPTENNFGGFTSNDQP